ncbi:MAG: hypothetical protein AAF514_19330 [Verrucomicrobiota bacterium]
MKPLDFFFALLCFVATGLTTRAQQDPIQEHLVPPHVIIEHADGAQLEDSQLQAVRSAVQSMRLAIEEPENELKEAIESLRETLRDEALNEDQALSNLEEVLQAEHVVKANHLRMLIRANQGLKPQQRKTLLAAWHKQRAQRQADQGSPAPAGPSGDAGKKRPEPPTTWISEKDLKAQIAGMRVEEVAWRRITWKTCLLDGLNASRNEKKPVILWVFIDRPVDDKRC